MNLLALERELQTERKRLQELVQQHGSVMHPDVYAQSQKVDQLVVAVQRLKGHHSRNGNGGKQEQRDE